jgi:hypothetical protein
MHFIASGIDYDPLPEINTDSQQCKVTIEDESIELIVGPCTMQVLSFDGSGLSQDCSLSFSDIVTS